MEQQTNMTLNQQPQLVVNQTDGEDEIDLAELFYLLWRSLQHFWRVQFWHSA